MTRPLPVTAYAAVSPDGRILYDRMFSSRPIAELNWSASAEGRSTVPVTILPTEQYEALLASFVECEVTLRVLGLDSERLASIAENARAILAALKEQDHG